MTHTDQFTAEAFAPDDDGPHTPQPNDILYAICYKDIVKAAAAVAKSYATFDTPPSQEIVEKAVYSAIESVLESVLKDPGIYLVQTNAALSFSAPFWAYIIRDGIGVNGREANS